MSILKREQLMAMLNNSGLATNLSTLQNTLIAKACSTLLQNTDSKLKPDGDLEERQQFDTMLLDGVGPAAASAAVDFAVNSCKSRGLITNVESKLNGNYVNNARLFLTNDDGGAGLESSNNFSTTLRQFLLPRYAYLDFDRVVDPRHRIDEECGYPKFIMPIMYRYMYDRDDVSRRVNDIYPDESWAADPVVYEDEDEEVNTDFEEAYRDLDDNFQINQYLYRSDKLAGIGHYSALLVGLDDEDDLEKPVEGIDAWSTRGPLRKHAIKDLKLMYLRPFDEYLSFIMRYDTDINSPRYGMPEIYNLVFLDMTIDAAGTSIGTRLNRRVHWSRIIHFADNLQSSIVFGIPRMQPVFNRLLDLRKIKGGSAEMFWKGAFPGISFEIDPRFVADDPEFDKDEFREEIENYSNGLQRYLRLMGVSAKSLAPQVADPEKHVFVQMQAIASHYGVPLKVFLGSEESRMAASQDMLNWNKRLMRRLKRVVEPSMIRLLVNRFISYGLLPVPKHNKNGKYFIDWGDLNTPTDEDGANLALKYTQAISQYVATGMIHLIQPMDYLTIILRLKPSQAKKICDAVDKNGGWAKLKAVDPSQGAGVNGKRENIVSKGSKEGTSRELPTKRDTADKKAEGTAS